jgi:hypothetical protein
MPRRFVLPLKHLCNRLSRKRIDPNFLQQYPAAKVPSAATQRLGHSTFLMEFKTPKGPCKVVARLGTPEHLNMLEQTRVTHVFVNAHNKLVKPKRYRLSAARVLAVTEEAQWLEYVDAPMLADLFDEPPSMDEIRKRESEYARKGLLKGGAKQEIELLKAKRERINAFYSRYPHIPKKKIMGDLKDAWAEFVDNLKRVRTAIEPELYANYAGTKVLATIDVAAGNNLLVKSYNPKTGRVHLVLVEAAGIVHHWRTKRRRT